MYKAQICFYFDPNDICSLCYGNVNTYFVVPFSEYSVTVALDVTKTYLSYPYFLAITSLKKKTLLGLE